MSRTRIGTLLLALSAGLPLVVSLNILTPAAHAQLTSGDIVGSVTDQSGAAIAKAAVTARNTSTGVEYTATAGDNGEFRVPNVAVGSYDITATASGFQTFVLKAFQVSLNQTSSARLTLPIATASTQVEVSAEAGAVIDTTTVQLQTTFSNREVSELPTATIGLGVLNVSLLSPNVATSGGVGAGTGPSVGGQRPRANNFTIEGIDNNDKSVTGPLVYIPNDAVGEFSLITNQFSPEFGHSAGGQFNTVVSSGTNKFHGRAYEYFQNRNLDAIDESVARSFAAGSKPFNPRYDFNRYGGQFGGPIKRDKLFFFANFERQTTGQNIAYALCTPTAAGLAALNSVGNVNANNLAVYQQYTPPSPSQVDYNNDSACGNQAPAGGDSNPLQHLTVYSQPLGGGTATDIPLGNYQVNAPVFTNFKALTTSGDWTISPTDSFRLRYIYNDISSQDTSAYLPVFFQPIPSKFHLIALSEYHNFSPFLTNEVRVGYNRYYNITPSGNFSFPGLDSFPNLVFYDQGGINYGPDGNAPQSTIQNLYQFTDNISWVKGKHTLKFGFDGRKFISPQSFTQRVRGDYEWNNLSDYLQDISPTYFGERSTGNFFYYGDQTALYGYANDTWRVSESITLNYGLRYEFTSIPTGERAQALNAAASVPGLISFKKPSPQYKNFAPRIGIAWAPDQKTSVRAGFGMAYDVLYDNLGILSFPPQYSSTNDTDPTAPTSAFLAQGGLPTGTGTLATFPTIADQRAATSGYIPDQKLPYAETWSLGIQRVFGTNYTAEVRYLGTRGIHLSTQVQLNKQARVNNAHHLPVYYSTPSQAELNSLPDTLDSLLAGSAVVQSFADAGFTSSITSFQPYSQSNYNAFAASLIRRFQNGLQLNFAYTWSRTMDDATADVFSTVLTPRRPQDSQNVAADYGRSALDRTHRITLEAIYDVPYFKHSNWLLRNTVGNWEIAPIYTYQSPEYATVLSGVDSNLNGDSAPDRAVINPRGKKGTGTDTTPLTNGTVCAPDDEGNPVAACDANTVAYLATNPDAYYVKAQPGMLANGSRNSLPVQPTNDIDVTALKRFSFKERYSVEFQAQAYNILNHPQFLSGSINQVNSLGDTSSNTLNFLHPDNALFNQASKAFSSNARSMQLALKFVF